MRISKSNFRKFTWVLAIYCLGFSLMAQTSVPVVTSKTGRVWMDRNLGASQVATNPTDPLSFGDLYQWGRGTDGHQLRTSTTLGEESEKDQPGHAFFIQGFQDWRNPLNDGLWQGASGINNPCPVGFRIPTALEWDAEMATWDGSKNAESAFLSPLKLPSAGYRLFTDVTIRSIGSGLYWTSTVSGALATFFYINETSSSLTINGRARGYSVRCIKD
jgi:uncharacterized protein (TIGR02145 family)